MVNYAPLHMQIYMSKLLSSNTKAFIFTWMTYMNFLYQHIYGLGEKT